MSWQAFVKVDLHKSRGRELHIRSLGCASAEFLGALHCIPAFKPVDHETSRIVVSGIKETDVGKKKRIVLTWDNDSTTFFCNHASHCFTKRS